MRVCHLIWAFWGLDSTNKLPLQTTSSVKVEVQADSSLGGSGAFSGAGCGAGDSEGLSEGPAAALGAAGTVAAGVAASAEVGAVEETAEKA